MSDAHIFPANERGALRLFTLDAQLGLEMAASKDLTPLNRALGIALYEPDVQIVPIKSIQDMGLPAFLQEAYDIDPDDLKPHTNTLNALTGQIALLRSGAFGGQAHQLPQTDQATLIATLTEPQPDWIAKPMPPQPISRPSPRAARSQARRIGFSLFAVMMTLITFFVIWLVT